VLVDVQGNDRYVADIYAQGSSYWYSLGLLIDDEGHDTYVAGQYSCGSGIHLSAGMLLDRAGNDSYHCLNGVGVGGAHDFAVGFLVDRGGDDHYSGSGGSQGGALTNSVAMLIDNGGDDGYCAVRRGSQGIATPARGTGGIGLLLDGGGKDVYSEATRDGAAWVAATVGAGLDEPSRSKASGEPQAAAISPDAAERRVEERGRIEKDGARVWDLDKLWALASEWEVNDNRIIVPIARKRLWALGEPALNRAFDRLGCGSTGSGLEFRAVEATIREFARTQRAVIVDRLLTAVRSGDVAVRKGAISVLGTLRARESADTLAALLKNDPAVRRQSLSALAAMKLAPAPVTALLESKNELDGMAAAACLGAVGDGPSITALLAALSERTPFLVRTAATERLADLGQLAVPGLAAVAADAGQSLTARRNALRALGKAKSEGAVDVVVQSLGSNDRWIRLSAYGSARALADSLEATRPESTKRLRAAVAKARSVESDALLLRLR
jgi:HEAT repeat protein